MRVVILICAFVAVLALGCARAFALDIAKATPAEIRAEVEALAPVGVANLGDRPATVVRAALARLSEGAALSPVDRGSLQLSISIASQYFTPRQFSVLLGKDAFAYFRSGADAPVFAARSIFAEEALRTITPQNSPSDWSLAQAFLAQDEYEKSGARNDAYFRNAEAIVARMIAALPKESHPEGYVAARCVQYQGRSTRHFTLDSDAGSDGLFDNIFSPSAKHYALSSECFGRIASRDELNVAGLARTLTPIMLRTGAPPSIGDPTVDAMLANLFNPANLFDLIAGVRALKLNGALALESTGLSPEDTRRARALRARVDGFALSGRFHTHEAQAIRAQYVDLLLSAADARPTQTRANSPAVQLITFDNARGLAGVRRQNGDTTFTPTTGEWVSVFQGMDPIQALGGKTEQVTMLARANPAARWLEHYKRATDLDRQSGASGEQVAAAFNAAIEDFRNEYEPKWAPLVFDAARRAGVQPGERLVIYPDGAASMLPIGLLRNPRTGRPLAEEYELVFAPGPAAMARAEQRAAAARTRSVAFVAPSQQDLTFTPIETAMVAKSFGLTAPGATVGSRTAIMQGLKGATYWHFATHAGFFPEAPMLSGLAIRPIADGQTSLDDLLTVADLYGGAEVIASPRLVVLSACETGLFDTNLNPDEFLGLPSGFLALGAAGVMASLWKVDDAATSLLMAKFYELHLAQGKRPSEALHLAQVWLKNADKAGLLAFVAEQMQRGAVTPAQAVRLREAVDGRAGARPFESPFFWGAFTYYGA